MGKTYRPRITISSDQIQYVLKNYELQGDKRIDKIAELSKKTGLSEYLIRKIISNNQVKKEKQYNRVWDKKELDILNDYAGFITSEDLLKKINKLNKSLRRSLRTADSLKKETSRLGLSLDVRGVYFSGNDLRKIFGITYLKLQSWVKDSEMNKILKPRIKDKKDLIFHRSNIKNFVVEYRSYVTELKGIKWDLVLELFTD